jgi:peptidoglycan/xylan/chitin deacetylase (PgdA/CDA1 family)
MNPWLIEAPAATLIAGAGMTAYGAVHPRAQLFGPTICRTNSPRKLAITFDDGPNPAITPKLLDLLDRYRAKATFFLIGRFARECPDLAREIAARGHGIGNHTDTHPNLFWLAPSQITAELRRCQETISNATGAPPKWFRPPWGFRNPQVIPAASALGCSTVMWTLLPGDWKEKPAEWLIQRMQPIAERAQRSANSEKQILRFLESGGLHRSPETGPRACLPEAGNPALGMTTKGVAETAASGTGDILCLHDGYHKELNYDRTRTLAALEHWLPRWRDLGLEFVTIDEAVR